jgi:GTP-binding protein EngB required for normal cell division
LILLIGKVDKIIKSEKNETKKDIYSELNTYLKLKKKEYEISSSSLFVDDKKNNIEIKKVIFSQEQINEILKNIDK